MRLSDKAMRVRFSCRQWTARKYDPEASKTVADKYGLPEAAQGRYTKILCAMDQIERINSACNAARTFHYKNSLPWDDAVIEGEGKQQKGWRIMLSKNFLRYSDGMREREEDFWTEVRKLLTVYPSLKLGAKDAWGKLYKESDFPTPEKLFKRFGFRVEIEPVSDASDWRVDMQADDMERLRSEYATSSETRVQCAMTELWERLHEAVGHMVDRLTIDPDAPPSKRLKVFRDTMIENLIDLTEILPALNITGDTRLQEMVNQVQARLCSFEPNAIREDKTIRKFALEEANDIAKAMEAYMGRKEATRESRDTEEVTEGEGGLSVGPAVLRESGTQANAH